MEHHELSKNLLDFRLGFHFPEGLLKTSLQEQLHFYISKQYKVPTHLINNTYSNMEAYPLSFLKSRLHYLEEVLAVCGERASFWERHLFEEICPPEGKEKLF